MVMTVLKVYLKKGTSVIQYRDDRFRNDLLKELIKSKTETFL